MTRPTEISSKEAWVKVSPDMTEKFGHDRGILRTEDKFAFNARSGKLLGESHVRFREEEEGAKGNFELSQSQRLEFGMNLNGCYSCGACFEVPET